jgi:division protein CdvB (Snf7/Vps24/ESCRT-III family)
MKSQAIANILQDDSFKTAMDDLVKMHLDMIINSDVDDKLAREICYMRITTINEIMAHLQSIADDKKINDNKWKI